MYPSVCRLQGRLYSESGKRIVCDGCVLFFVCMGQPFSDLVTRFDNSETKASVWNVCSSYLNLSSAEQTRALPSTADQELAETTTSATAPRSTRGTGVKVSHFRVVLLCFQLQENYTPVVFSSCWLVCNQKLQIALKWKTPQF